MLTKYSEKSYQSRENMIEPLVQKEKINLCNVSRQERIDASKKLKMEIKELMLRNPTIQTPEIVIQTGYSEYQILRAYLPLRRELFAREMR